MQLKKWQFIAFCNNSNGLVTLSDTDLRYILVYFSKILKINPDFKSWGQCKPSVSSTQWKKINEIIDPHVCKVMKMYASKDFSHIAVKRDS